MLYESEQILVVLLYLATNSPAASVIYWKKFIVFNFFCFNFLVPKSGLNVQHIRGKDELFLINKLILFY